MLTVPYFVVSPMDLARDNNEELFKSEQKWLISANEVYDANKQIEFVNNAMKTDVKIKYTFLSILIKNLIGFAVIGTLFQLVKQIYSILLNQKVWFGIAIFVFFVCTGGLVYSMLN